MIATVAPGNRQQQQSKPIEVKNNKASVICSGLGQIDSGRHIMPAPSASPKRGKKKKKKMCDGWETKLWSLQAIINADGILHERDPFRLGGWPVCKKVKKKKIEAKEKSWEASHSLWRKIITSSSSCLDKVDYSRLLSRIFRSCWKIKYKKISTLPISAYLAIFFFLCNLLWWYPTTHPHAMCVCTLRSKRNRRNIRIKMDQIK